jgi:HD-GYP domain-containing protein (c-di-GMP phosphodiesterase class II)
MKFLKISTPMLKMDAKFPFNIFLYDPSRDQRIVALHARSPVKEEELEEWQKIEQKNGYLQISREDEESFLEMTQTPEELLYGLNEFYFRMQDLWESRQKEYEEVVSGEFLFKEKLHEAVEKDDFSEIINRAKAELLLYPITISQEVSMMTHIVEKLFVHDSLVTRISSFTYFFAKSYGITDQETMAQVILGSLFKDVGLCLVDYQLFKKPQELLLQDIYLKHPMLSVYLLSKSPIKLSKNVKRIILEQHEQCDGKGYPRGKKEEHLSILSQIVQTCDHMFKFSNGDIDGKKWDLLQVMGMIHKQNTTQGLVSSFSQGVLDVYPTLISAKN